MAAEVSRHSSGGAENGAVAFSTTRTQLQCATGLLCLAISVCCILSLICTCLVTLLVLLEQKVETASYQHLLTTINVETMPDLSFRLPKEVKPLRYTLSLHPDLEKETFEGKVTILIDVLDRRSYIALHQKDLNITSASLKTFDREENFEFEILDLIQIPKYEMFVVRTKDELHIGQYNLSFEFDGVLHCDKTVGLYLIKYKDTQNRTKSIITSNFEPTHARRAYPCFDEPAFTAEFKITLVRANNFDTIALSNMQAMRSDISPSRELTSVTFEQSMPISTYLTCFLIGEFTFVTKKAKGLNDREFPINVYTTHGKQDRANLALNAAVKIIQYHIDLFRIDYPLQKLDIVAIPDFASVAMGNWGLIRCREERLLFDETVHSKSDAYHIVAMISRELAYTWFGNLVTMSWWNDLWLSRGFASFLQYKSTDAIYPEWGTLFLMEQMHSVFETDAKLSSHPIVQTVDNIDEITAIFDDISYKKGASIIRMMENVMKPTIFYNAISSYLNKFMYHNAEAADLFKILQEFSPDNLNVTAIMDTWTRQKGFPVVNVKKSGNKYILTQKRFLANPDLNFDPSESEYGYKWTIPITYITNNISTPILVWFDKDAEDLVIEFDEPVEWIKFNAHEVGYYRVNYEQNEWKTFYNVLQYQHETLSAFDRAHLLEDAFSLASVGELSYVLVMNMSGYLKRERHPMPWYVASTKIMAIHNLLDRSSVDTLTYRKRVRYLMDDVYTEIKWLTDRIKDRLSLRREITILQFACCMVYVDCVKEAGRMFIGDVTRHYWTRENGKIVPPNPDNRELVYYYGMYFYGDELLWECTFNKFKAETDMSEKLKLMRALTAIQNSSILEKFIVTATDENYVRAQDFLSCLIAMSENPVGQPIVWEWVRSNWKFLVDRYTLNDRHLGSLIPSITKTFATETRLNEMKCFFAKYPDAGVGATNRAKALETVSDNIRWLAKRFRAMEQWMYDIL